MEMSHFHRHRCVERSTECDCPICGEYLFTSPDGVVFMPCGHSIHRICYSELMKVTYRCPICSRSIANMERQFLDLRREIEMQRMPEEFRDTKAWIHCNDCLAKTKVKYLWLGLECAVYVILRVLFCNRPSLKLTALHKVACLSIRCNCPFSPASRVRPRLLPDPINHASHFHQPLVPRIINPTHLPVYALQYPCQF